MSPQVVLHAMQRNGDFRCDAFVAHRAVHPQQIVVAPGISNQVSKTVELPRPTDIDESLHLDLVREPKLFPTDKSAEDRFAWACSMTEICALQADRARSGIVARIVGGGTFGPTEKVLNDGTRKTQLYSSRIPGVIEEIVLSAQAGRPVIIIGAFGGVARLMIDQLIGIDQEEASWAHQKRAPFGPEMKDLYHQRGLPWLDYPERIAMLRGKGMAGLNPLLPPAELAELAETADEGRLVELVLAGRSRN